MKAAVFDRYGTPDVLEARDIPMPAVADNELLVRIRAASVNPLDLYGLSGTPLVGRLGSGLLKPKSTRLGVDFAGIVEAAGKNVSRLRVGDEVFGGRAGAFAEYVTIREERAIARKPSNLSFEEAAAVPIAAITALQGLRDKGQLKAGHKALINGASGGVGTFAIQIAKALGAVVTAVCSTDKVELARSLGADRVIDYTEQDFTRGSDRYDVMLDIAGSRSWSEYKRILTPDAIVALAGAPKGGRFLGPLGHMIKMKLGSARDSRRVVPFMAQLNVADLDALTTMFETGTLRPVIDRSYGINEIANALRYLDEGHARGKIVVSV